MTSTTITVPGVLVAPVREGALAVSRDVAEAIDHGKSLRACRERLAGVCRLLDAIGWTQEEPASDVEVDLGVNAATLRAAIATMLPQLQASGSDRERGLYPTLRDFAAELGAMPCWLAVPGDVVVLLRRVLRVEVARVAQDLEAQCSLQAPGDLAGMLARFDVLRAALDAIGWANREHQQPVDIDSALYGQTISDVLEADLVFQRSFTDTDDCDASEREGAANTAAMIERFLSDLKGGRS
jgi:hypothetical protein